MQRPIICINYHTTASSAQEWIFNSQVNSFANKESSIGIPGNLRLIYQGSRVESQFCSLNFKSSCVAVDFLGNSLFCLSSYSADKSISMPVSIIIAEKTTAAAKKAARGGSGSGLILCVRKQELSLVNLDSGTGTKNAKLNYQRSRYFQSIMTRDDDDDRVGRSWWWV